MQSQSNQNRSSRGILTVVMAFALLLTAVASLNSRAAEQEDNDILVRLQSGVDPNAVASDYSTTVRDHVQGTNVYSMAVPAGSTPAAFATVLSGDPRVYIAEPNGPVDAQIHIGFDGNRNPGAYVNQAAYRMVDIGRVASITQGDGVIVAVLDTGVALDHPALRGHLVAGENEVAPGTPPQDVADGTTNLAAGHGTMIAGLIAKLAPHASIMPVRVLNGDGTGTVLSVIKGMQYALAHGARVINVSFGTAQESDSLDEALDAAENAGAVVVASAGNDGSNVRRYPASSGNAIAVASVDVNGKKSSFSNYGPDITVSAPGSMIRSTYLNGEFATWSGTSVAVPFVSAAAALVMATHPGGDPGDVKDRIRNTARSLDRQNPTYRGQLGSGVVDFQRAVTSRG